MKRPTTIPSSGTGALSSSTHAVWLDLLAWAGDGVKFRMADGCERARTSLGIGRAAYRNAVVELERFGFLTCDRPSGARPQPGTAVHLVPQISTSLALDPGKAKNAWRRPLGAHSAVYRIFSAEGVLLYVGCTRSMPQRWRCHARTQPWWSEAVSWTNQWYITRAEAELAEEHAISAENPRYNIQGRERES